jgi:hypothetical protein
MLPLGYNHSSGFSISLFELCGKHDIVPIESEINLPKFFEKLPLLFLLLFKTLNPFLLMSIPLFYLHLLLL